MEEHFETITSFVSRLENTIEIKETVRLSNVFIFSTANYYVYIYLPGSKRNSNHSHLKTIHLDIDVLIQAPSKLINRIIGLHGYGQKIYARQTVVARVDKRATIDFLEDHHLQPSLAGKYRYGLYKDGELVSLAVFGGARRMYHIADGYRSFELLRFCHKGSTLVVGGLSKLIKSFVKDFNPHDIMTYADLDWTEESSLGSVGFKALGRLTPQKFYIVNGIRQSVVPMDGKNYYCLENNGSLKLKLIL